MKRLITFIIVALCAAAITTAAQAAQPPCAIDEYGNCIAGLEEGYATEEAWESAATGEAVWGGCKTVHARRNWNSIYGFNVYRYYQQVTWCWSGGQITSLHRARWAEVNAPLWQFDGHISTNCNVNEDCSGRTGIPYTTTWTQGQFHVCAVYEWVCNYQYPLVSISVSAYGGWNSATSG